MSDDCVIVDCAGEGSYRVTVNGEVLGLVCRAHAEMVRDEVRTRGIEVAIPEPPPSEPWEWHSAVATFVMVLFVLAAALTFLVMLGHVVLRLNGGIHAIWGAS